MERRTWRRIRLPRSLPSVATPASDSVPKWLAPCGDSSQHQSLGAGPVDCPLDAQQTPLLQKSLEVTKTAGPPVSCTTSPHLGCSSSCQTTRHVALSRGWRGQYSTRPWRDLQHSCHLQKYGRSFGRALGTRQGRDPRAMHEQEWADPKSRAARLRSL